MYIVNSSPPKEDDHSAATGPAHVSLDYLRHIVQSIAMPRHFSAEPANNAKVREWIASELRGIGLEVGIVGEHRNVVAGFPGHGEHAKIIIGAHYDSVPGSPGADDNASAIAGLIATAKALKAMALTPAPSVMLVAFNSEEDGLLGSQEFVQSLSADALAAIECVHVLEMIGFASDAPGSQSIPQGLPIRLDDVGNFIAVIANRHSNRHVNTILRAARTATPQLPVKALKAFLGAEKLFPHLHRSDHAPFWQKNVPALMWTDTSEFRNPHYHRRSDLPDTLNYGFMAQVCELLVATVVAQLREAV